MTQVDVDSYMNVWICNLDGFEPGLLGYASFPSEAGDGYDGIVLDYRTVKGGLRTMTHEVSR